MGRSCCVPGCKSNYGNADHVTIFKFPKDKALRESWLRNIHREDFDVNDKTVVCVKHFEPKFVVREDIFPTEYGEPVRITRKNPKLTNDAIPTIFPDPLRCARRQRTKKVTSTAERNVTKRREGVVISNFDNFKAHEENLTNNYVPADPVPSTGHVNVQPPSNLHMSYHPLVHVNLIPPFSFSCLNFMAIEDSPNRALSVQEIYGWILQHFPYFKNAPAGWKNSVRHKLSINKCFRKVEKAPNLSKGCLWMVDSEYRPILLQALQKSPFYPFRSLDRVPMANKHDPSAENQLNGNDVAAIKPNGRLPNPELFPLLSRRMASSAVDGDAATDDGDVAAAMLALHDAPRLHSSRKPEWYMRPDEDKAMDKQRGKKRKRASKKTKNSDRDRWIRVITTSPGEDHTYSVLPTAYPDKARKEHDPRPLVVNRVRRRKAAKSLLLSDAEEQRRIAEGAAALLNLAGITTRKRSQSSQFQTTPSDTTVRGHRRGRGGVGFGPRLLRSVRLVKKSRCCQLECR